MIFPYVEHANDCVWRVSRRLSALTDKDGKPVFDIGEWNVGFWHVEAAPDALAPIAEFNRRAVRESRQWLGPAIVPERSLARMKAEDDHDTFASLASNDALPPGMVRVVCGGFEIVEPLCVSVTKVLP